MKNKTKKDKDMDILDILLLIFGISILIFLFRKYIIGTQNTQQSTNSTVITGSSSASSSSSGSGSNSEVINQTLKSFNIQDGHILNGNYTKYASTADATDKNFEESGFVNRNATIYAKNMVNGEKAYSNAEGTTLYPAGVYFYDTDFTSITIAADGTMTFSSDIQKPSSLTGIIINDGFNA